MTANDQWCVGQIVDVQPRTWAGINRLGGTGKIVKLHYSATDPSEVEFIDVKYTVNSGSDKKLQPHLVTPHDDSSRTKRRKPSAPTILITPEEPAVKRERKKKRQEKRAKKTKRTAPARNESVPSTTTSRQPETNAVVESEHNPVTETTETSSDDNSLIDIPASITITVEPIVTDGCCETEEHDGDSTTPTHKLEDVYRADVQEAEEFVEDLQVHRIGATSNTDDGNERDAELERFTSALNELLLSKEGMLEEEEIPLLLQDFPSEKVPGYVDQLCTQNKIMRTDGCIYNI